LGQRPEMLVLDIGLPDIDGCEVLDRVHLEGAWPRVFVLSAFCSPFLVFRLGQVGIHAFLDKTTVTVASLRSAFSEFTNHRQVFSPSFIGIQERRKKDPLSFDKLLTNQQMRVLSLVAHNFNDQAIASHLKIGPRTVENHRTEIMRKLGIHSRVDLMRFAADQGFSNGPAPSHV
jgi:DNA-binding NarL/FixJ family response regulator